MGEELHGMMGARVAAARDHAGLSKRELAALAGIDRATLRELEAGREPRVSTLAACARTLASLVPSDLLPVGIGRVPVALDEAWRFQRHVQSIRVRLQTRTVRAGRVEDLLSAVRGPSGADLTRLMRSACLGGSSVLSRVACPAQPGGELVIEEEGERHEFRRGRGSHARSFSCRRTRRRAPESPFPAEATSFDEVLEGGCHAIVQHPVDELRLSVQLPTSEERSPLLLVWPAPLVPSAGENLAPALHPGGVGLKLERHGRRLRATIRHPLVGLRYGLGWSPLPPDPQPRSERTLANQLRRSRESAGLSMRGLAEEMGASAMTVKGAEEGRDLRVSTLERAMRALPALSPWSLLCELDGEGVPSRERAWAYWRDLFGCEVAGERKLIEIASSGGSRIQLETRGLRRVRTPDRALVVRLGMARSVLQPTRASLDGVETEEDDGRGGLRIRRVTEPGGEAQHQLVIPAGRAATGVSFSRKLLHAGVFTMSDAAARERTGIEGPFREGSTFGATVPARRLELVVRFPRGYRPEGFRVHAWGVTEVPDSEAIGLADRLHPEGLDFVVDRRRRSVELAIEHALPGIKYALGWQLP